MESTIAKDLKELDKQIHDVPELLTSSAQIFEDCYSENIKGCEGNYCWPYCIQGRDAERRWPVRAGVKEQQFCRFDEQQVA
jgi:hypothetical protein